MNPLTSKRLGLLLLALVGCSVPDLDTLEREKPRECNAEHRCRDGELCFEGFCQKNPCDGSEPVTAYRDADADGHAAVNAEAEVFCGDVPPGYATPRDDCDDARAEVHPGLPEACDGLDNDCQEGIDNGLARTEYFRDADGDREGSGVPTLACAAPTGFVAVGGDCDDSDSERARGNTEVCDGKDNDCAGGVDDGLTVSTYYRDADGDGVGVQADSRQSCRVLAGYVQSPSQVFDCDDTDGERTPGKADVCDGKDNDCVGGVDDGFDRYWYRDEDGDTYGRNEPATVSCESPGPGYVHVTSNAFDCNDNSFEVHPGAAEKCNNRDDNCVGGEDEPFLAGSQRKGASCNNDVCTGMYVCNASQDGTVCNASAPVSYFPDVDGDGEGAAGASPQKVCSPATAPAGKVTNAQDCDDVDPSSRKAGLEICDAVDNDCNGQVDDGLSCGGTLKQVSDVRLGGSGHDWRAVAVGPGGYPVWFAGLSGKLAVRKTVGAPLQSFDGDQPNSCATSTDWLAAWVRPSDGSVFLAGASGSLAQHSGHGCALQISTPIREELTGITGFESDGVTTLFITGRGGHLYRWVPGSPPTVVFEYPGFVLNGVAGPTPGELYIAGGVAGEGTNAQRLITTHLVSSGGGSANYFFTGGPLEMRAVCMGSGGTVFGGGFGGHLWTRTSSTNWTRMPWLSGLAHINGVAAPPTGASDAYVIYETGSNDLGVLRRATPYGLARSPALNAPVPLYGIAMSSAGDFWVVGDDGYAAHYPER